MHPIKHKVGEMEQEGLNEQRWGEQLRGANKHKKKPL